MSLRSRLPIEAISNYTAIPKFSHPKLALYLFELNGGLVFNRESPDAKHYEFWFNAEQKRETLREKAMKFINAHEYFTAQDVAGAEVMLGELVKNGAATDVSFKSDKTRKYMKAKAKGD